MTGPTRSAGTGLGETPNRQGVYAGRHAIDAAVFIPNTDSSIDSNVLNQRHSAAAAEPQALAAQSLRTRSAARTDTEEATGSIPVPPTKYCRVSRPAWRQRSLVGPGLLTTSLAEEVTGSISGICPRAYQA